MKGLAVARGLAAALAVVLLSGCGGGIASPDLFEVRRTGGGAPLTLVVNDGGTARCNGGAPRPITDAQLVQARGVEEELRDAAGRHTVLAARPGSVFGYYLRDEAGTVQFADNSAGESRAMRELQEVVLGVGRAVCGKKD